MLSNNKDFLTHGNWHGKTEDNRTEFIFIFNEIFHQLSDLSYFRSKKLPKELTKFDIEELDWVLSVLKKLVENAANGFEKIKDGKWYEGEKMNCDGKNKKGGCCCGCCGHIGGVFRDRHVPVYDKYGEDISGWGPWDGDGDNKDNEEKKEDIGWGTEFEQPDKGDYPKYY